MQPSSPVCNKWWQLFSEGFAQRCEHLILGQNTWHQAVSKNNNWVSWCYDNQACLASEFLQFVAQGKDIRPFFGSWHNIDGYSQCGYFLGHEVIKELELSGMGIREIAVLENPESHLRKVLEEIPEVNAPDTAYTVSHWAASVKSFKWKVGESMMNTNYVITRGTPSSAEQDFLEARLYEHNCTQTKQDDGQLFGFFVRNEQQEIVAGLTGWTWAHACEVRDLWVHPALRGQGYGQSLLKSAEQEAQLRRCKVVLISSYSFQAPAFYQKHGYELAWKLIDFPPGHQYCYLVKRFTETG